MTSVGDVWINGEPVPPDHAGVSVFDIGFQRGYGCFEAMRCYNGVPFRLDRHLTRLSHSASLLGIPLRSKEQLGDWCLAATGDQDGVLRVYVTGGVDFARLGTDNATVILLEALPVVKDSFALDILDAPWHADGRQSELSGAKTLSYGPNLAATMAARARGFDDAVLVGAAGTVLEGPTFSLAWIRDGTVFTPSLSNTILESVTREAVLEVAADRGVPVQEGSFPATDLLDADEVIVMSTVREVRPVHRIGDRTLSPGGVTQLLRAGFDELVAAETR